MCWKKWPLGLDSNAAFAATWFKIYIILSFHSFSFEINHFHSFWMWVAALPYEMPCLWCKSNEKKPAIKSLCVCDFCQSKPASRTDMLPNLGYFIKLLKTIIKTKSGLKFWHLNLLELSRLAPFIYIKCQWQNSIQLLCETHKFVWMLECRAFIARTVNMIYIVLCFYADFWERLYIWILSAPVKLGIDFFLVTKYNT